MQPGIPTGGQWSPFEHSESVISLDDGAVTAARQLLAERPQRVESLRGGQYVAAVAVRGGDDPRSTRLRKEWWDTHFVAAEYSGDEIDYPQMPDDFTPRRTGGRALSGNRRTHRMSYRTAGDKFAIRMPSATSVKAFEAEGNGTFDIPVSAADRNGNSISGWARVTRSGTDWNATALGDFGEKTGAQVGEAVASVLEARRPSQALKNIDDLLTAHRERKTSHGQMMSQVQSSFISSVGFDEESSTMAVRMSDRLYGYHVSAADYRATVASSSPGATYGKLIKGSQRVGVERCPDCGRFSPSEVAHTCPITHRARPETRPHSSAVARAAAIDLTSRRVAPAGALSGTSPATAAPAPVKVDWTGDGRAQGFNNGEFGLLTYDHGIAARPDRRYRWDARRLNVGLAEAETGFASSMGEARHLAEQSYSRMLAKAATTATLSAVPDPEPEAPAAQATPAPAAQAPVVDPAVVSSETFGDGVRGPRVTINTIDLKVEAARQEADRAARVAAQEAELNAARMAPGSEHAPAPAAAHRVRMGTMLLARRDGASSIAKSRPLHGFTASPAVVSALSPHTSSHYVPDAYDYSRGREVDNGAFSTFRFAGVRGDSARQLLGKLPPRALAEAVPGGPTLRSTLLAAARHPGRVELGGYLVGPDRSDERISVENVDVYAFENDSPAAAWERTKEIVNFGPDVDEPSSITQVENPWRPGQKAWRFGWTPNPQR